jgi:GNAT superfamily N-acetyltransferase
MKKVPNKNRCEHKIQRTSLRKFVLIPDEDNGNVGLETKNGRQAGSVWWRPTGRKTVEIEHLEIYGQYWNRGLGQGLLRAALSSIREAHPYVRYISAAATSRGVIRLMERVMGRELGYARRGRLPRFCPDDWLKTKNRLRVRFAMPKSEVAT